MGVPPSFIHSNCTFLFLTFVSFKQSTAVNFNFLGEEIFSLNSIATAPLARLL